MRQEGKVYKPSAFLLGMASIPVVFFFSLLLAADFYQGDVRFWGYWALLFLWFFFLSIPCMVYLSVFRQIVTVTEDRLVLQNGFLGPDAIRISDIQAITFKPLQDPVGFSYLHAFYIHTSFPDQARIVAIIHRHNFPVIFQQLHEKNSAIDFDARAKSYLHKQV